MLDDAGASPNFFQLMKAVWAANVGQDIFEAPNTSDPKNFQTEAEKLVDTFFFQRDEPGRCNRSVEAEWN